MGYCKRLPLFFSPSSTTSLFHLFSFVFSIGLEFCDGWNIVRTLTRIRSFIAVVLTFICFLLLGTFPGWHQEEDSTGSEVEVRPFPSRPVMGLSVYTIGLALGFCMISVLWQHINSSSTASMVETLTYGAVSGHVGVAAMALGWVAAGLIGTITLALLIMQTSITLLRRLTDSDLDSDME